MNKSQSLQSFWESFSIPAYDSTTVPDDAELPYITYGVALDSFGSEVSLSASIWYRGPSWQPVMSKLEEVASVIGRGGVMVPYDGGAVWITRANPFAQRLGDPDKEIRRVLINLGAEFISNN